MLSEIEKFVLGGNTAHDLISLSKEESYWIITVSPAYDHNTLKRFIFRQVLENYEQDLTDEGEVIEYPLPIIGFDSKRLSSGLWHFCLNAAEVEWGFQSEWPEYA